MKLLSYMKSELIIRIPSLQEIEELMKKKVERPVGYNKFDEK